MRRTNAQIVFIKFPDFLLRNCHKLRKLFPQFAETYFIRGFLWLLKIVYIAMERT